MRILLTWSDRGSAGPRPAHHSPRPPDDQGPVGRLVAQDDAGPWDAAIVLTTPSGEGPAHRLATVLRRSIQQVDIDVIEDIVDPSDHAALFAGLGPVLARLPRPADVDVVLSAGTPQCQTLWVLLGMAGLLDRGGETRLLQVIPARFVPDPHPRAWREVTLDIEGFPEVRALRSELASLRAQTDTLGLTGHSPPMQALRSTIARAAQTDLSVLILGETGTGKERVAQALHRLSRRSEGPFIAENCAALPEGTLASELFGHEAGAFTGAAVRRRGLFELAHGGTLLLDEVGEMPLRVQASLLRVLQEGELRRVGGERAVRVDVRVVAATHRDLAEEVAAGRFRADLYYRLRGVTLDVPPLRARTADLETLVHTFAVEGGRPDLTVDPTVWPRLRAWGWPGNVRELRAEVMRWCAFCVDTVRPGDLAPELQPKGAAVVPSASPSAGPLLRPLAVQVAALEAEAVAAALAHHKGNKSAAARQLGIDRNTLKRKL